MRRLSSVLVSLAVVTGMLVAAPVAVPALLPTAQAAVKTRFSPLTATPPTPGRGEVFSITGRLSTRVARPVKLQLRVNRKWRTIARTTTNASGRFTLRTSTKKPRIVVRVRATKVKIGKTTYRAYSSASKTIRTGLVRPGQPIRGEQFRVSSKLKTHGVRPVKLQLRVGARWKTISRGTTKKSGYYLLTGSTTLKKATIRVIAPKKKIGGRLYRRTSGVPMRITTAAQSASLALPSVGYLSRTVTAKVQFSPVRERRAVAVQVKSGSSWKTVGAAKQSDTGAASIAIPVKQLGTFTYRAITLASNGAPAKASRSVSLTVKQNTALPAPAIATNDLIEGVVGQDYSETLSASYGTAPLTWSATGLPSGLSLDAATGEIGGVPTEAGTSTVKVVVTDANAKTDSRTLSLVVRSNLSVDVSALLTGTAGVTFSASTPATGGVTPYTWSAWGLPAGVSINEDTGEISGVPPNGGTFPIFVTVTDAEGRTVTESAELEVDAGTVTATPPLIDDVSLPDLVKGDSYAVSPTATGGTAPYTWSASGLPEGAAIDATTGELSGTATKTGDFTVYLMVTDSDGLTSTKSFTVRVYPAAEQPPSPTITTSTLPSGVVGDSYSATLAVDSGRAPFTWSATGLPDGLSVNATTGVISGTPTVTGTSEVQVTVTDKNSKSDTATVSLVIGAAVSVTTDSLADGLAGEEYSASLAATGGTAPYAWSASGLPAGLSVSGHTITGTPTESGTFSVQLTVTDDHGKTNTAAIDLLVRAALGVEVPGGHTGTAGEPFTASAPASGGVEPYTWSAWGLPNELVIDPATGAISGTARNAGVFPVFITVTDAQGRTQTTSFELTISAGSVVAKPPTITTVSLSDAIKGQSYAETFTATGGTEPYAWTGYGLPDGLSLDAATGELSGTPTQTGDFTAYVNVIDSDGLTSTKSFTVRVYPAAEQPPSPSITTSTLPAGVVDDSYSATLAVDSGRAPFTWSVTGLPTGLSLDAATGVISGTPTAMGTSPLQVTVTDKNAKTDTATVSLTVGAAVSVTTDALADGIAGEDYSATLAAAGGTTPYGWAASGLPAGLSVSGHTITGTPTESGTFSVQLTVTDDHGKTNTATVSMTIAPAVSVTTSSLPEVVSGEDYSADLAATGGTSPYRWSASGLPAGLSVSGHTITGAPTESGTFSVQLTVTDDHDKTDVATLSLLVRPTLDVDLSPIVSGTAGVAYTASPSPSGGVEPYAWTAWGLPAGLTINATTGEISGTPLNGGTFPILVTLTDTGNRTVTRSAQLTIDAGSVVAVPPMIDLTSLPDGIKGESYAVTAHASLATAPYAWSGTGLPDGLSLDAATGELSGTPTKTGDFTVYLMVTDAAGLTSSRSYSVAIYPAAEQPPAPAITTSALPAGVVDDSYSATLAVDSGRAPFTWSATGLPTGLTLNAATGVVSGTPTVTGTSSVQLTVTDKNGKTDTATVSLSIGAAVSVTTNTLADGIVGEGYSANLAASGGTTPYSWSASGLPAGLSVSGHTITGSPSVAGVFTIQLTVTDDHGKTNTGSVELTIAPAVAVTTASLATGVVAEGYSANLAASGGTTPYSWSASGLPAGLSVSGPTITGTPTESGTFSVQLTVTDDHAKTDTATVSLEIRPVVSISTTALPDGIVGHAMTAQLEAAGGTLPYSWSATGLPDGLSLNADSGLIEGTPSAEGSFTVHATVTDGMGRTDSANYAVEIGNATTIITTTLTDGMVGYDYDLTLSVLGGLAPYQWSATDLPAGLSIDPTSGAITGVPTSAATASVTITASDSTGQADTQVFELIIKAGVSITTTALDRGEASSAYTATVEAAGGVPNYTWSATGLPAGLSIDPASGAITGTPSEAGITNADFTVSDANGKTATATLQLVIGAAVAVTTTSLPDAIVGTAYEATLAAEGGTTPYNWAVQGIPDGLTVDAATGVLSGTPTTEGSYALTVTVTDANSRTASHDFTVAVGPAIAISTASLPNAVRGTAYSYTAVATGGRTPYHWSATGLPAGLSINATTGEISGTPSVEGLFAVSLTVTDLDAAGAFADLSVMVGPAVSISTTSLPAAVKGTVYATTLNAAGGTAPYTWSVSGLPSGLSVVASTGVISGTPTASGVWQLMITATDANGKGTLAMIDMTVNPSVSVATSQLPTAVVGTAYSTSLSGSGGTAPYTWSSTALPAGLILDSSTGAITGTPTTAGTSSVTFTITDANSKTATKALSLTRLPAVSISTVTLPGGIAGIAYSSALSASGGATPYTWSATALPDGLNLDTSGGVIVGTTSQVGTFTVSLTVTDNDGKTASKSLPLTIGPAVSITTTSLPEAGVGVDYNLTVTATGGASPYSWSATGLPSGLSLSSSTGAITGTPDAVGVSNVSIMVTDDNGQTATQDFTLSVIVPLAISTTSLPEGIVGESYSATVAGVGGTAPYTWGMDTLPAGLGLDSDTGAITGTPIEAGAVSVTITTTDALNRTVSKTFTLTVSAAVSISTTSLPNAVMGTAYSATVAGTGGTVPYTWAATGLPSGLSLDTSTGVISGTPSTEEAPSVTITVTDNKGKTDSVTLTLTVGPAVSISTASLSNAVVGTAYSFTLAVTGGTAPFTWAASGLPSGLSVNTTTGVISGTPTAVATPSVTVTVTDNAGKTDSKTLALTIGPAVSISTTSLTSAVVDSAYSFTLVGAGGTTPYTWAATNVPAGLSVASSTGVISGTPTTAGTKTVTITVTDNKGKTASKSLSLTVAPGLSIATATLPVGSVGTVYSTTLTGSGGRSPYSWTATNLPAGLSISSTGVISGTPTAAGAPGVTITVTDSDGKTASKVMTIDIAESLSIVTASLPAAVVGDPVNTTLEASGGTAPYTWSSIYNLPGGLSLNSTTGVISGTPTTAYSYNLLIQVRDAKARTYSRYIPLSVAKALAFATSSPLTVMPGVTFSHALAAVGGTTPYTWSATDLPAGVSLDGATGVVSGTLSTPGETAAMQLSVTDAHDNTVTQSLTIKVAAPSAITSGKSHSCAIVSGGAVCWGSNAQGQLGVDTLITSSSVPLGVDGLGSGVTAISAGDEQTCAVVSGAVKCWGGNGHGDLGNGSITMSSTPVTVSGLTSGATAVAAGAYSSCAVVSGAVKCWGWNAYGQLGDGTDVESTTPVSVSGLSSGVTAVSFANYYGCAVVSGAMKCWGWNALGQLGDGSTNNSSAPVAVTGLSSGVSAISTSGATSCAIVSGAAKCWGANFGYQLMDGTTDSRSTPVSLTGLTSDVTAIAVGNAFACATVSGAVKCWGANAVGQAGDGTAPSTAFAPTAVTGLASGATAIDAGYEHTCAVLSDGVKCWGSNFYGQLGDGTTTQRNTPVDVKW